MKLHDFRTKILLLSFRDRYLIQKIFILIEVIEFGIIFQKLTFGNHPGSTLLTPTTAKTTS